LLEILYNAQLVFVKYISPHKLETLDTLVSIISGEAAKEKLNQKTNKVHKKENNIFFILKK